ncbi:hypothetical protein [Pelistega europaea]|uniref:Uncharacterized protein n=1 Tax=Pelistega europaea TaxID=106147 RepID=A0A7Y4L7U9_9BURK|nr:hypothetical protein [Pelistega europaea]NOL48589.1 hypothetical protein [Pelistega europaea]
MEFLVDFIYHQPPMVLLIAMQALWVICVVMGLGGMLVRVKDTVPTTSRHLFL